MHTVEVLDRALTVAESLGYGIRHEWLGGSGGGACEFAGRKWIFVDLALGVTDQLEQVVDALRDEAAIHTVYVPPEIQRLLDHKQVA